ncbi:MAG: 5-(carboxyamino)imidazole ribonucleotide mutase [Deltaproteobacteria bacterium]|nr:5-(carboxyamino)imidazole ribonucleotide mutase [Deltaproteobacteria bacterium]
MDSPLVAIVMGSRSDLPVMQGAVDTLSAFGVPNEVKILSAHRTPQETAEWVRGLETRGVQVLIAAAGGAAHLAGVAAALTLLPVLGVPLQSPALGGIDSLLSIVQMPAGVPVGTLAIGQPGATNAALLAVAILALSRPDLRKKLADYREEQRKKVLASSP